MHRQQWVRCTTPKHVYLQSSLLNGNDPNLVSNLRLCSDNDRQEFYTDAILQPTVNAILHKLPFDGDILLHTSLPGNESLQVSNGIIALEVCNTHTRHAYWWVCMEAIVFISNHQHSSSSASLRSKHNLHCCFQISQFITITGSLYKKQQQSEKWKSVIWVNVEVSHQNLSHIIAVKKFYVSTKIGNKWGWEWLHSLLLLARMVSICWRTYADGWRAHAVALVFAFGA